MGSYQVAGLALCISLLGITLMGIWDCTGYYLGMAIRQFEGTLHAPLLSDLSDITCDYGDKDIDAVVIKHASSFWKKLKSSIDYPTCLGDDYEWSIAKFREWRATRDPYFIIDLSLPNPLNPRHPADILRNCTLKFEVIVESTHRSLR